MYFDELYAPLKDMQDWQQTAFSAALCERIFPHYALYDSLLEASELVFKHPEWTIMIKYNDRNR